MNLSLYTCSCRSIWKILCTSLYVLKSYRIHHSPWSTVILWSASSIAFFSSSWVISCTHGGLHPSRWIYTLWSSFFRHGVSDLGSFRFIFIWVNLEFSSLVLRNKSHPSFLVGGCTGPFLQFKCTSYMVRTIKHMHNDKLF